MNARRVSSWSLGFIAVVICIALGVAGGSWLFSPTNPEVLSPAEQIDMVPVSEKTIDDSRGVEIVVTTVDGRSVVAPATGKVTALACDPGTTLVSGASHLSVDGVAAVSLATSMPLWRDLTLGDEGEDVAALQAELARIGYDVLADGELGEWSLLQTADLLGVPIGQREGFTSIPLGRLLWIPGPQVAVKSCEVEVGSLIQPGETVFVLADELVDARIKQIPRDLIEGARVLVIGELEIPIGDEGEVANEAGLAALEESDQYRFLVASSDLADSISAQMRLADPVTVYSVPPASVYDLEGDSGCVLAEDGPLLVRVVSSELGQTLVEFADNAPVPTQVKMQLDEALTCR